MCCLQQAASLAVVTGSGQEQPDICLPQHMGYQGSSSIVAHLSHISQPSSLFSGLPPSTVLTASRINPVKHTWHCILPFQATGPFGFAI